MIWLSGRVAALHVQGPVISSMTKYVNIEKHGLNLLSSENLIIVIREHLLLLCSLKAYVLWYSIFSSIRLDGSSTA